MFDYNSLLIGLCVGLVLGGILAVALSFPRVARGLGKLMAVALMGAGAGLIAWGLFGAFGREPFEPMKLGPVTFYTAAQTLGWGIGFLTGGITALVLSFVGHKSQR